MGPAAPPDPTPPPSLGTGDGQGQRGHPVGMRRGRIGFGGGGGAGGAGGGDAGAPGGPALGRARSGVAGVRAAASCSILQQMPCNLHPNESHLPSPATCCPGLQLIYCALGCSQRELQYSKSFCSILQGDRAQPQPLPPPRQSLGPAGGRGAAPLPRMGTGMGTREGRGRPRRLRAGRGGRTRPRAGCEVPRGLFEGLLAMLSPQFHPPQIPAAGVHTTSRPLSLPPPWCAPVPCRRPRSHPVRGAAPSCLSFPLPAEFPVPILPVGSSTREHRCPVPGGSLGSRPYRRSLCYYYYWDAGGALRLRRTRLWRARHPSKGRSSVTAPQQLRSPQLEEVMKQFMGIYKVMCE